MGSAQIGLGSGRRTSKLVPELVPESEGRAAGYVEIRSDQLLIAQQLFAALNGAGIQLFSAVAPRYSTSPRLVAESSMEETSQSTEM